MTRFHFAFNCNLRHYKLGNEQLRFLLMNSQRSSAQCPPAFDDAQQAHALREAQVGRCRLTPGCKQSTARLLSRVVTKM